MLYTLAYFAQICHDKVQVGDRALSCLAMHLDLAELGAEAYQATLWRALSAEIGNQRLGLSSKHEQVLYFWWSQQIHEIIQIGGLVCASPPSP